MNEQPRPKEEINWFRATWQVIVVLIVFAALGAVLFPVYTGGGPSHHSSCLSNLKQIRTAGLIYEADNDDRVTPHFMFDSLAEGKLYMASIQPYLKNTTIFACPENQKNQTKDKLPPGQEDIDKDTNYTHALSLRASIQDFAKGSRVIVVGALEKPETLGYLRDTIQGYGVRKDGSIGYKSAHTSGFAVAFMDGHAKFRQAIDEQKEL